MTYTKQQWQNGITSAPYGPINAARLQHIEDGLEAVANGGSISFLPVASGGDDTAALIAALTAAPAGNIVRPSSASYNISSIVLTRDDLTLDLTGTTLVSSLAVTDDAPVLSIVGSRITVRGGKITYTHSFAIDTDARNTHGTTLKIGGTSQASPVTDVTVENLTIDGGWLHGVEIRNGSNMRIRGCHIKNCLGSGAYVSENLTDVTVENNLIESTQDDGIMVVCATTSTVAKGVTIRGNSIRNTYAKGIGTSGVDGVSIANNVIENTYVGGIQVFQDSGGSPVLGPSSRVVVTGNVITGAGKNYGAGKFKTTASGFGHGIYITTGASRISVIGNECQACDLDGFLLNTGTDWMIVGNLAAANGSNGFELQGIDGTVLASNRSELNSKHGYALTSLTNCSVTGNVAFQNNAGSDGVSDGFNISGCSGTVFDGNSSVDDRGGGVQVDQHYDISGIGSGNTWGVNVFKGGTKAVRWGASMTAWAIAEGQRPVALTDAATVLVDLNAGNYASLSGSTARVFGAPSGRPAGGGRTLTLIVKNASAGSITHTFNAAYVGPVTAGWSIGAGKSQTVTFFDNGTNLVQVGAASGDF